MIVQKSEELVKLIERRREIQENAQKVGGLRTRHGELQDLLKGTKPLVSTYLLFRQNNICKSVDKMFVENVIDQINELSTAFTNDPETLNQARSLVALKHSVTTIQTALGPNLKFYWQEYVDSQVPETNEDLMGVLGQISTFNATVETVRKLQREIALMRETLPSDQVELNRLATKAKILTGIWQKLGSDEVPQAVLQFLRQAVTRGAPLSMLTTEVSKWLADYKIIDSFIIRLSSGGS